MVFDFALLMSKLTVAAILQNHCTVERAVRSIDRRRCDRRDVDQSALEDEQVAGAQLATGPCALFNNARKQRSASETAAWSSCRAVILGIVEMQRRWSAHTSASGWPCSTLFFEKEKTTTTTPLSSPSS
ncbi:Transcription factor [Trichinella spiralis]|uniref:Transcription factor n=1 Tax=Trichinella spiralis TaxID=6334 RepID=A0ABR3KBS1_TRISP